MGDQLKNLIFIILLNIKTNNNLKYKEYKVIKMKNYLNVVFKLL